MLNKNLFANLPQNKDVESVEALIENSHLRVERIVSYGQASPPGFWYDQPKSEWVVVLTGKAKIQFEDEPELLEMKTGDHVQIDAHRKHRVEWTDPEQATVWLAIHF